MMQYAHDYLFGPDIKSRLLARSRPLLTSIIIIYVLFVKWIGPAIMKNRKPFKLKEIIFIYNAAQVIANGYFTYRLFGFLYERWEMRCKWTINPLYDSYYEKYISVMFMIYLVKVADLLDTVFFVLRKNDHQVTFLHTFHHAVMAILGQTCLMLDRIGFYVVFCLAINEFIHCCTYTYYTLSIMGPHMQKYLWWKRYLTELQMLQFVVDLCYMTHSFWSGCEEVGIWDWIIYSFAVAILILLCNFYISAYMMRKKKE